MAQDPKDPKDPDDTSGETEVSMLAGSGKHPWEDYDKRLEASKSPLALGSDLFGDAVNLQDGALSFSVTDVSLPGNQGLPVAFARSYRVFNRRDYGDLGALADWEIDLPRISATTAQEWLSSTSGGDRCSDTDGLQPAPSGFYPHDYFQGMQLQIPGAGGGELLVRYATTGRPTDGKTYPWMTEDQIHVSCLASIDNRTGEGFLAVTPDGTKYWFEWMAQDLLPYMESVRYDPAGVRLTNTFNPRKTSLYATRVEDVAGNWVEYSYGNAWNQTVQLNSITSSDGRTITVSHAGGRVSSVSNGTHSWTYQYGTTASGRGTLTDVVLPDTSRWDIDFAAFTNAEIITTRANEMVVGEIYRTCRTNETPHNSTDTPIGTISHPSGASGTFTTAMKEHGLSNVPVSCGNFATGDPLWGNNPNDDTNLFAMRYYGFSLTGKAITGPGLAGLSWSYAYAPTLTWFWAGDASNQYPVCTLGAVCHQRKVCSGGPCDGSAITTVSGPNGTWERYEFGNSFKYNEGKLLKVERGTGPSGILETTTNTYDLSLVDQIYPAKFGESQRGNDNFAATYHRPMVKRETSRQGATFTWEILKTCSTDKYCTDAQVHPKNVKRHSTLGFSRTEVTTYWGDFAKWIIGRPLSVVCNPAVPANAACNGDIVEATTYDTLGRPTTRKAFGKLQHTLTYDTTSAISTGQRGTLKTYKDGLNNVTTLGSWHRGVPRQITYPGSVTESATVNGTGTIASTTDENGFTTSYQYDPVGRMTQVTYPAGDSTAWAATGIAYAKMTTSQYGLPAGHWRQTVQTGNGTKITYFDGLMRPAITHEFDSAIQAATQRFVRTSHDHEGRNTFTSYPSATSTASTGVTTTYDPLGRVKTVVQHSELGNLTTTTSYPLSAFQVAVTNPRTFTTTTTSFQAWDAPTYDLPLAISHPASIGTGFTRDAFGKPLAISRAGGGASATRTYAYNANQELCRQVEPETDATLMGYDAAGNLAWSASGLAASTACSATGTETATAARKTTRTYDARNRLTGLDFADSNGDQSWTYTPDGLPQSVTTWNNNGSTWATNVYTYNKRRMLTGESQTESDRTYTWAMGYGYNANGHLAALTYPDSLTVDFAPNALGQATKATSATQNFATAASYFPNGGLKQFTYGNGIIHTLSQNARGLPDTSRDAYGATEFLDDQYDYDHNGNVAAITDARTNGNSRGDRDMVYDALDRLTSVLSPMWGNNTTPAAYTYDALDNIVQANVPQTASAIARNWAYCYTTAKNRLDKIRNGTCTGTLAYEISHDVQGNVTAKGASGYVFDFGNRLRSAGAESYRYDAHGRRVRVNNSAAGNLYHLYGRDGQLFWTRDERDQKRRQFVYLAGSLVAEHTRPVSGSTETVTYQHTDALGSPVVRTNQSRGELERIEYEPYGKLANKAANDDLPGYTGHVMDSTTGMTYMQQRYYDPGVGMFMSVDPVTALSRPVGQFHRYRYANNNPYSFGDPDGRRACPTGTRVCYEAPSTKIGARQPALSSSQKTKDSQVASAQKHGRLSDGTRLNLSKAEQSFTADTEGTSAGVGEVHGCMTCDGKKVHTMSFGLAEGSSPGHTHGDGIEQLPGRDDASSTARSGRTAYMISKEHSFAIEHTSDGYRVRVISGPGLERTQIRELEQKIETWNQYRGTGGGTCTPGC